MSARSCLFHLGAESPYGLVWMITSVNVDFTLVSGPSELAGALRAQARRCTAALDSATGPVTGAP